MGFVVLFAVALVAAALLARFARARRRPPASAATAADGAPTFRVVALGPRGSGKTLLLASMYHQMQTPSGRSYFFTAPYDQVAVLNQWFTQVADTGQDWPGGTTSADTREFMFTVRTRAPSGRLHTVMKLGYLEYAGGLLTDPQGADASLQTELLRRIESADALIGLIDGFQLRQWIDGKYEGQRRVQHTLTAMIGLMMLVSCPITFVITKWDLLADIDADENGRLQIVRKLLMSNQGFRDLVNTHSYHRVVRLVPVSAVGPTFAAVDDHGLVTKLPGGEMHPTNVDAPLASVVPDVFEQVQRKLDHAQLQAALASARGASGAGPVAAIAELGSFVVRTTGRALGAINPLYAAFVGDAVAELFGRAEDSQADRQARVDRRLTEVEREIEEFHLARRKVIREFQSRVDILEGRLPASRLSAEH
ncbi:hypothetical protein WEI85_16270 [Actinomycetes bacterium KLBMP 9797]